MTELLEVIDARIERSAGVYDRTLDELAGLHEELERLGAMRELAVDLDQEPVEAGEQTAEDSPDHSEPASPAAAPSSEPAKPEPAARKAPAKTAAKPAAGKPGPEAKRPERVYDVIAAGDGPVSRAEIAAALGCAPGGLSRDLKILTETGRIVRVGGLRDGGFQPTEVADAAAASPDRNVTRKPMAALLRDVNATIVNDPGLTEEQLAQALSVDREDIAVATGELLSREWVVLRPDGTYEPAESDGGGGQP